MKIILGILAILLTTVLGQAQEFKAPCAVGQRYFITLETTHNTGDNGIASEGLVKILKIGPGRWMQVIQVREVDPKKKDSEPLPIWVNFDWVSTVQEEKIVKSVNDKKAGAQ